MGWVCDNGLHNMALNFVSMIMQLVQSKEWLLSHGLGVPMSMTLESLTK